MFIITQLRRSPNETFNSFFVLSYSLFKLYLKVILLSNIEWVQFKYYNSGLLYSCIFF